MRLRRITRTTTGDEPIQQLTATVPLSASGTRRACKMLSRSGGGQTLRLRVEGLDHTVSRAPQSSEDIDVFAATLQSD